MKTAAERTLLIETMHRKYAGVIYDLCVRILKDPVEAEDAVQETFINAFRALDSFSYGDTHLPWLYRIGTNSCLKMLRTKKRKGALPMENIEIAANTSSSNVTYLDPTDQISVRGQLEALQKKLDDRNMEIVVSHFVLGMNQQEVGDMLGISRRAVVKRLTKLKKELSQMKIVTPEPPNTGEPEDDSKNN